MNNENYQKWGSRFADMQKSGLHIKNYRCGRNIQKKQKKCRKKHKLYKQLEKNFIDSKFTILRNSHIRFK